ncbi:glutamine amidotransferase [Motiliproteus sp. MSK22-1]|nr:glutamine amidotransferase [Motiliproteus sp. MSK22-1]
MTDKSPVFLVIDGYPEPAREELQAGGASVAGELYKKVLQQCAPGSRIDILFGADNPASLPSEQVLSQYDGIVWTGSNLTIYQDVPEVSQQIDLAQTLFKSRIPQFGSCWAAQLAVTAAGGSCAAHPAGMEFGIARSIALTQEGRSHPLFQDKKSVFDGFISHCDEITHLPPGAQVLAGNDHSKIQAVSVTYQGGVFWAVQYHPEYDLHELATLCHCRREAHTKRGFFDSEESADVFVKELEKLHRDASRKDIAWRLGISPDLTNTDIRQQEIKNWINHLVLPSMDQKNRQNRKLNAL